MDEAMRLFIDGLLDVQDNYINFDYLVVEDQTRYEDMKEKMAEYFRTHGA